MARIDDDESMADEARRGGPGSFPYTALLDALLETAVGTLITFKRKGTLFDELRRRGIRLQMPAPAGFADDVDRLIVIAARTAGPRFMRTQVTERGWDKSRGAALTTFFVQACLYAFGDEYRRYCAEENWEHEVATDDADLLPACDAPWRSREPEGTAVAMDTITRLLGSDDDSTLKIVFIRIAQGYTHAEIAAELGTTPQTLTNMIRRFRRGLRERSSD